MPRFLFPDKKSIDESEMTNKYTGLGVAGSDRGTSISIGYMGECYIDFGAIFMFIPILLLGIYYGLIYSWFVNRAGLFGMAVATALLLFNTYMLETSSIKIVGGVTAELIVLGTLDWMLGMRIWSLVSNQPQLDELDEEPDENHLNSPMNLRRSRSSAAINRQRIAGRGR